MVKFKPKTMSQYCIDASFVEDVLKAIPSKVSIESIGISINRGFHTKKKSVPLALRKLGVTSMQDTLPVTSAHLKFSNVPRDTIIKNTKTVCNRLNANFDKAYVTYVDVAFGNSRARFKRIRKEIVLTSQDVRKKIIVLGHTFGEGNLATLFLALSAEKYACEFRDVVQRTVICSKARS
jgi:hypothetical protein